MLKMARGFSVGPCVGLVRDAEHPTIAQSERYILYFMIIVR